MARRRGTNLGSGRTPGRSRVQEACVNPKIGSGYAPYDPATGKIHLAKTAERAEDVPQLEGCIVIPVLVSQSQSPLPAAGIYLISHNITYTNN